MPQRNSTSAAHVSLSWLTDRAMHRTPQNCRCSTTRPLSHRVDSMWIFAGIPLGGELNESGVVDDGNFWRFEWYFFRNFRDRPKANNIMTICCPLSACDSLQNKWLRITLSGYFMSKSVFGLQFLTRRVWVSKIIACKVTNIDLRYQQQRRRSMTLVFGNIHRGQLGI